MWADLNSFRTMTISAQSCQLDMKEVLSYPLGHIPWSLATDNGYIRMTSKSVLERELIKGIHLTEDIPAPSACIQDGMAIVHIIHGDKKTFDELAETIFALVLSEGFHSKRIDVVFDDYRDISIKTLNEICGQLRIQ